MDDPTKGVRFWVTFGGCVLVVVVLYWAHAIFVPFVLAVLLTFVLAPPVTALERWVGRVPAVLIVVTLVFTMLGMAGWVVARQVEHLAGDLPTYRQNIRISRSRRSRRSSSMKTTVTSTRPPVPTGPRMDRRHQDWVVRARPTSSGCRKRRSCPA